MPKERRWASTGKERTRAAAIPFLYRRPDDQILDGLHHPGNIHDSNGAYAFISHCMRQITSYLPYAKIETRIDSAFFNETIVQQPHSSKVEFTVSVPFECFATLKGLIEGEKRWRRPAVGLDCFETRWKPNSWNDDHRFILIGKQVRRKADRRPDLFRPMEYGCEFKVIVTNKRISSRKVVTFHEGRRGRRRRVSSPDSGRIIRPVGKLILSMKGEIQHALTVLNAPT